MPEFFCSALVIGVDLRVWSRLLKISSTCSLGLSKQCSYWFKNGDFLLRRINALKKNFTRTLSRDNSIRPCEITALPHEPSHCLYSIFSSLANVTVLSIVWLSVCFEVSPP